MFGGTRGRSKTNGTKNSLSIKQEAPEIDDGESYTAPIPKKASKTLNVKIQNKMDDQKASVSTPKNKYEQREIIWIDDGNAWSPPNAKRAKKLDIKTELRSHSCDYSGGIKESGTSNDWDSIRCLTPPPTNEIEIIDLTDEYSLLKTREEKNNVHKEYGEQAEKSSNKVAEEELSVKIEPRSPMSDSHCMTDEFELNIPPLNANHTVKAEGPSLTAIVFVAANFTEDSNLAIIGEDQHLGRWKTPQGSFERIKEIGNDLWIFKGVVPVPSLIGSEFRLVNVNNLDQSMEYEGEGRWDNRTDELLPDSWNFFIFKPKPKFRIAKIWEDFKGSNKKSETKGRIAFEFFNTIFNHVVENAIPDWNHAFETLDDCLQKIQRATGNCSSEAFCQFLDTWLEKTELLNDFDQLFLVVVGACKMDVSSSKLNQVLKIKSKDFSLYLHNFINLNQRSQDLDGILEHIAIQAGPDFWWIFFCINRMAEDMPIVLLENAENATRVVDYLIRRNDIDDVYCLLHPAFEQNPDFQLYLSKLLLQRIVIHTVDGDGSKRILCSKFLKELYQSVSAEETTDLAESGENDGTAFLNAIKTIFNSRNVSDAVRLAYCTPDYLLPVVTPIAERIIPKKLKSISEFSKEDYCYFAKLEENSFDNFPECKQLIKAKLLKMAKKSLKLGSFEEIPSLRLTILALAGTECIHYLERPKLVDLQKIIRKSPRKFFQNLDSVFKKPGTCIDKTLKPFRKGETRFIVEKLENHFDLLEEILSQLSSRRVQLIDLDSLQDPQVLAYLKSIGFADRKQAELHQEIEELRGRHKLYGLIYSTFARLNVITSGQCNTHQDAEHSQENDNESESIQVLDPKEWEAGYLKMVDPETSNGTTLQDAMQLPVPLQVVAAQWLLQVKECALFMSKIWHPLVKSWQGIKGCAMFMDKMDSMEVEIYPLRKDELHVFVSECATEWMDLARSVANGNLSFQEMDDIIKLQPDANILSQRHMLGQPIEGVSVAYRNFKNLHEIRHLIGPFVAALRFFTIRQKDPINNLYHFVQTNLLEHWDTTTLAQVTQILRIVNEDLDINPERPDTRRAMQFLSSLVTEGDTSPLIEWLREKNENDMEAMGKILHGSLLEAYGQLRTLRTRIAPFLQKEFKTYQDLLKIVRISEERFAARISGRVQPVNCKWLTSILPEIEAAVRASIISPSEDAKEKLAKISQVVIRPTNESYSMEIQLHPTGSLTLEELKQAFQLLDMAVAGESGEIDDVVAGARTNVGRIVQLSEIFDRLFVSGCISYTFCKQIVVELADMDIEIHRLREHLEEWNKAWESVEELPILALFSRSYLLRLADLIARNDKNSASYILRILLPSASFKMETLINELANRAPRLGSNGHWLTTAQPELVLPPFLIFYAKKLQSYFIDKEVVLLNVTADLLVGSSLAAYISLTRQPIEPSRILFVTTSTEQSDVKRFMKLWAVASALEDLFMIVHVERLTAAGANEIRDGIERIPPERRTKLLLLAQHQHRVQATQSLGVRLGLASDRLLDINFTAEQLRPFVSSLLPNAENLHFFSSKLPGCGKSQQAMLRASRQLPEPDYYRMSKIESRPSKTEIQAPFLHLDVAHSVSLEFNDILLLLLIHGALYDPKKAKLGFWIISPQTVIALEFASPFGVKEFPIIAYVGEHHVCECNKSFFSYDLAVMPTILGQSVTVNRSNDLVAAGKFLLIQQAGEEGLRAWDNLCSFPELFITDPLSKDLTFDLLVASFQHAENQHAPTFTALNAMASFLYKHISAMTHCMWFNESAVHIFEREDLAKIFIQNVFSMLIKVANDSVARCWSIANRGEKLNEMNWINRQRAMFLLGVGNDGSVSGMNVVGRDADALKNMFHASVLPFLQRQCIQFQEFHGFRNLTQNPTGAEVILNAMRSLLLLDGTPSSAAKVYQLDSHPSHVPVSDRLRQLIGQEQGYVLTGDNITKMMFALYRIRCGLPVVAFGEAGVGKSALFRFLIETLLGHTFAVCNVNSGTSIRSIEELIEWAITIILMDPQAQVFLFFDELNTAEPPVIAFFKELMLDRHFCGTVLPENIHLMAAANPYRRLRQDIEAPVGLAFRFAQAPEENRGSTDVHNLVYRVNDLPLAFYEHVYDFGHLCNDAEDTYIEEICRNGLPTSDFSAEDVEWFISIVQKSHRVAREMSADPESVVSLRDTTRAVQLFRWFYLSPAGREMSRKDAGIAADLTIYLVYAFRFPKRKMFLEKVFGKDQSASKNMTEVSRIIAKMLYENAHGASIGSGAIALNDALCENLFALYVCVLNGIFLIIVGRPGSSKSLSVEILKLVLSPGNHALRHSLGDLPAITEVYFQCSPLSTSSGFKALFESAKRLSVDPKTMLAMVVLDELGLADMSPEKPMKVLHAELERQSVLTTGEKEQTSYAVVALSNWVVDAAQVNRGILILHTQTDKEDLLSAAKQLTKSLVSKYVKEEEIKQITRILTESLESIVNTYEELDKREDLGGGHLFSMRDFFFCVKNFVCSVLASAVHIHTSRDFRISQYSLIQSVIRNFGGVHEKARRVVRRSMANYLQVNLTAIPEINPVDLIISNVRDSSNPLSIHIARHLMILSRSLVGLQLLNLHVKNQLDDKMSWNVLFGSCFPGDLQVTAVTRKLRQVEQAIRKGGVLILCHADQLFESLYMVLNQQYWAQGEVTMTQLALGPSIRAIALPHGPFRIIALQDTDVALNRDLMSPAILSRFEKHELRPSHLLDDAGRAWLNVIESHSVWLAVPEAIKRKQLIYGYHEESFCTLALHLQNRGVPTELDGEGEEDPLGATAIWMRSINPMAMIKLENNPCAHPKLLEVCRHYRHHFVLESIDDALQSIKSNRLVIMTNSLRHLEITLSNSSVIRLFDVNSELQLFTLLESVGDENFFHPNFCLIVQYDAVTGPIEQFQLAKYELEQRFEKSSCRIVFVVHVDPRPSKMHWVFSFGDGWDYCFVDEVVPNGPLDQHQIPLGQLIQSHAEQPLSFFIKTMTIELFKSLLLDVLGPTLQTSLASLRSSLGKVYAGIRTALALPNNQILLQLMKECLIAQLDESRTSWHVVDVVSDASFDSSSALTKALWNVFKHKISSPLAHLLVVSEVWRVTDDSSVKMWCEFVSANYPDRLMLLNPSDLFVQTPIGFGICYCLFGRLLVSFEKNHHAEPRLNGPLQWLLDYVGKNENNNSQEVKEAYFIDWFLLHVPQHLHRCLRKLPLSRMVYLVDNLFEEPAIFYFDWEHWEGKVTAALEVVSIASFAKPDTPDDGFWSTSTGRVRNWKSFIEMAVRSSLTALASPGVLKSHERFIQSISSIEDSPALVELLHHVEDLPQVWLSLRISKHILLFDPESDVKLPELQNLTSEKLFDNLTQVAISSVIRPRVASCLPTRRLMRQADLYALLTSTSACSTAEELAEMLEECPTTNSLVLRRKGREGVDLNRNCPSCSLSLTTAATEPYRHLQAPRTEMIESLFQDHQHLCSFSNNDPHCIRDFLHFLLSSNCRLRVSWRFLTVIVRTVLSTRSGSTIMDDMLSSIRCNNVTPNTNANAHSLLRALLVCSDQDVRNKMQEEPAEDVIQAAMTDDWTINRIRKLAVIRQRLAVNTNGTANAIAEWARWRKNRNDQSITDALLFFILRFSSDEGDPTRLSNILHDPRIAKELDHHKVVRDYVTTLSPLSLGFPLQAADVTANPFQECLLHAKSFNTGNFMKYRILLELQPVWAPFIARLAYHANEIFVMNGIHLLKEMGSNLVAAAKFLLPGMDNHPYLPSFTLEPNRWYLCTCGTLCCLGNCGRPVAQSVCTNCHVALGENHRLRAGARSATVGDFKPPSGIYMTRVPVVTPNFTVRNCTPVVTRFALLLNSLALMNAALNPRTQPNDIIHLLLTLPPTERQPDENCGSFMQLLSNHIIVHLDLLCQLLVTSRPQLTMTDKFRIGHLLLHKLLASSDPAFFANATEFTSGPQAREAFENGLTDLLGRQTNLAEELDEVALSDEATITFRQSLLHSETSFWAYSRRVFSDRRCVQLELARNNSLRQSLPFLNLLMDDKYMDKLDALQHFGPAMRFLALVRTVMSGEITQEEANSMSIAQGLDKLVETVSRKAVTLDRGRPVRTKQHVMDLFVGFKQLWERFSNLQNAENKTFLDYFECQQIDANVRPKAVLEQTAPLILICAGSELPEATFCYQLLNHAAEAASSIALTSFIQPHCRPGCVRLSCSNAAALTDFDESSYAHVSAEEVDRFIRDHVIDRVTLQIAESFAKTAVLGSAASTIAENVSLAVIPEFVFKDDTESRNYLLVLERRSLTWQPSSIPPHLQELILADLEKNRILAEAQSALVSAITHVYANTEPFVIRKVRNHYVSDVLEELTKAEILTERHVSNATLDIFNRHLKLQVCHSFGLLKAITMRMKGDDVFGGRVPEGWTALLPEHLMQLTSQKLRSQPDIIETLLQIIDIIAVENPVPIWLTPDESLLFALRQIEGPDWNGIPAELKMEHLGHVLLIAESLAKV
ncbi:hypothetical protein GHT06_020069 [Daphnia sinensis]|uniref:AAA+ ATPase domain-containing protein n=1 Tax=Daphnia sinensis TaxID=1820382 RepID=A0AAD5PPX7_9CRUS|nr:hypothetical protein GHT06_020069 [Daphnia sinensis]